MTDYLLSEQLATGKMVRLLPDWRCDPIPVHVVYPQNRHLSAKVRVFVEWIAELFANHAHLRVQPADTTAPTPALPPR